MVLCATRDTINESLLYCCVQILVLYHLGQPPLLQQASEHLTHIRSTHSSGVLGSFIADRVVIGVTVADMGGVVPS